MASRVHVVLALCCVIGAAWGGESSGGPDPEAAFQAAVQQLRAGHLRDATDSLRRVDTSETPAALRVKTDFLLGALWLRQGSAEQAVERLERASDALPLLGDYALFWLASACRSSGRFEQAAGSLRRLLDQHPGSLLRERASRSLPRDYASAGDSAKAEEAVGQYLQSFPGGPGRAEAWLVLGEVFQRSGRSTEAEEIFRRLWLELPAAPESERAKEFLAAMPGARAWTSDELFRRASTLYQQGRYSQAAKELAPFALSGPREAFARLALGISAFQLRQYPQATRWLEPLPMLSGADRSEALFWLARSLGRSGDSAGFVDRMRALADLAPPVKRQEEALFLLAQSAADAGDPGAAHGYLARLLQAHPTGAFRDQALWLKGWMHYKLGELPAAVKAWETLGRDEKGSRLRAQSAYWRGRALEESGKSREASRAYQGVLTDFADQPYYHRRAADRLRQPAKPLATSGTPGNFPAGQRMASGLHIEKARALKALGLQEEAAGEYTEHVRLRPEDRAALSESCEAFLELQRYDKAIWLGGKVLRPLYAQEQGAPPIRGFWYCVYPRGYWDAVVRHAGAAGLDPNLVAALIREESAFAPRAVSRTGARGLMQLMPQTAERVARASRLPLTEAAGLETPEVNIRLGTLHLAELVRGHDGRVSLALASYNAGKQAVERWLDRFGLRDEEEFIEDIPFGETRNYVKRVLGSYDRYARIYGAESRASSAETQEPSADLPAAAEQAGGRESSAESRESKGEKK
jgi:soluble lytic murein transglycosylase